MSMNSLPNDEKFDSVKPLTPMPGISMKGRIKEYRPGRWRIEIWHSGKKHCLYSYSKIPPIPFCHPKLAQRILEHINSLIDRHEFDPADWAKDKPFSFEKAAELWVSLSDISPEWLTKRKRIVKRLFLPFFSGMDIRSVRRIHIDNFLKSLRERKLSDRSCHNMIAELKCLFNYHKDSLPRSLSFPEVSYQEKPIRWLNKKHQDEVFEFITDPRDRAVFTFMRYTGCRPNEAGGLLRENVDSENKQLTLTTVLGGKGKLKENTKTKIAKPLPIIPEIEDALKPREATRYVFSKRGRPYSLDMLTRVWRKANARAHEKYGTPLINLYNGLKHSFGCQRLNAGFSVDQIRRVFGHTNIKTTMRYAAYMTDSLANVMSGNIEQLSGKKGLTTERR